MEESEALFGRRNNSMLIVAAQYLRMSDEHQKYSTRNQSDANHVYAARHGMTITRSYADEGISGLSVNRRDALKRLIRDVESGAADFTVILVYDISRWGRFQDPDEAAYYEFTCKRAGISVHYCAEPFENDGSPLATLFKSYKRAAAGEYSRELSVKVHVGQSRLARMGYRLGGHAGYGLRRLLIDENGAAKGTLESGQWKNITTDRIVLAPGPTHEVETVRLIFSLFVRERQHERQIATLLNERGVHNGFGGRWYSGTVGRILRSEKYLGNLIWNRSSFKLQKVRINNSADQWIRTDSAFEALIDRPLFNAAQAIFRTRGHFTCVGRPRHLSDEAMLEALRRLWQTYGYLDRALIDNDRTIPSSGSYARRFGGLKAVFQRIGFRQLRRKGTTPGGRPRGLSDEEMLDGLRRLLRKRGYLTQAIIGADKSLPGITAYFYRFGSLTRAYELIGFSPDPRRTRGLRILRLAANEALLAALRKLLEERGCLSRSIIDGSKSVPSHGTIENRFGGLMEAYRLIGYTPDRYGSQRLRNLSNDEMLEPLRKLLREHGYLTQVLVRKSKDTPSLYAYYQRFGGLLPAYKMIGYAGQASNKKPKD